MPWWPFWTAKSRAVFSSSDLCWLRPEVAAAQFPGGHTELPSAKQCPQLLGRGHLPRRQPQAAAAQLLGVHSKLPNPKLSAHENQTHLCWHLPQAGAAQLPGGLFWLPNAKLYSLIYNFEKVRHLCPSQLREARLSIRHCQYRPQLAMLFDHVLASWCLGCLGWGVSAIVVQLHLEGSSCMHPAVPAPPKFHLSQNLVSKAVHQKQRQ